MKFGEGTVTAITEGGRDYEVSVDFDSAGTKRCLHLCEINKSIEKIKLGKIYEML